MSVDVFGRNLGNIEGSRGTPGVGFKVTADGHYDMENKKYAMLPNLNNRAMLLI